MAKLTYKNLHQLVSELIDSKTVFNTTTNYTQQLSRASVAPITGNGRSDASSSELIEGLQSMITDVIESRIISGLEVRATDPITNSVTISAGKGYAGGKIYELAEDTTLSIPFDMVTSVFYISLYLNRIVIDGNSDSYKLTIAKIIVPEPTLTNIVRDTRDIDNKFDAFIVNFNKYNLYGIDGRFEEDTIELLRDNMNPILTDNLIGNLKLSEGLKIINTAGTLEMDSKEIRIKDGDTTVLAKFNKNGTYFYNTSGVEVARFTSLDARIGNIIVTKNSLASTNFVSGALGSGFQILDNGDAEFNNVLIRGKFKSAVFEKDTISAVGGNLLVMDADILGADMTALDASTLTISGDTSFAIGDILRIRDGVNDEWMAVTNIASAPTYTVTRDRAGVYSANDNPPWKKGTTVVNYGATGEGGLFMTSSEANAPYLSILTHAGSPWATTTTHLRLGNLNGFLGYASDLFGIAIGTAAAYLKYDPTGGLRILGSSVITSLTGARVEMFPDANTGLLIYDDAAGEVLKVLVGGTDVGDLIIGNFAGNAGLKWDKSAGTFTVRGALNADDISAGTLTGRTVQTATSGARVVMDTTNLVAYNSTPAEIFKILISGADVGDVIIGDYANSKGVKWDNSASTFNIKGIITATSGDFTGTVNVGVAGKVYIDGANECIKVYDGSNNLRVQIGKLS